MASLPTVTLANHTSILTGAHPGHHGILHNAWYDRAHRRAGHHQLAGDVAVVDAAPHRRASSRSTTRCTARGPTRSPRRSTSRATSAPTTRRSTSSGAARCRRSPRSPDGLPAHDRALRASVEGLLVVVGRRPHGRRAGGRHLERPLPRRRRTRCRASCGATSRSPTPRCTKAARTRRSPTASVRDSDAPHRRGPRRGRAAPACSTTPRSCSSPTTAWRRPTRPCTRRLGRRAARRRHPRSATRATASSTSATMRHAARPTLSDRADGRADAEGDGGDDRADERHAQPGAPGVPTGEDRGGGADGEQRQHRRRPRRRWWPRCRCRTGTG